MTRRSLSRVVVAFIGLLAGTASAQDAPPVSYATNSPLLAGSEDPRLEIASSEPIDNAILSLNGPAGVTEFRLGDLEANEVASVEFRAPDGAHHWEAQLTGDWQNGAFEVLFEFDFEITEGLAVTIPVEHVDLAARSLVMVLNRPAARATYRVIGDDGSELGHGEVQFDGQPPGTALPVRWQQSGGNVLTINLTAYDTDGFWAEVQLVPWSLDIPHEEVNFASGSDVIEPSEEPKIDAAYTLLEEAVARYGEFVEIQLYVAGYTDTVGSTSDNQSLSERRARSIAEAFRRRGFRFPIFYQGFGESAPEVPTPDSTDEPRNRRALYVLAAQPPLPSPHIPSANWRAID